MTMGYRKWFEADAAKFLDKLRAVRKVDADGNVSLTGFVWRDYTSILLSAIKADSADLTVLESCVRQAVLYKALPEKFTADDLLIEVNKRYSAIEKDKSKSFVVLTGIYLSGPIPFTSIVHKGVRIRFFDNHTSATAKALVKAHVDLVAPHKSDYRFPPGLGFRGVKIFVEASEPDRAYRAGTDAFDEIRGLLNLTINRGKHWRLSFGSDQKPLNDIRPAEYSSVHHRNGKPVGGVWFERGWSRPPNRLATLRRGDSNVRLEWFNKGLAALRREHPLAVRAAQALRTYCRALDKSDWKEAFLDLWVLLEYLTLVEPSENHTKVVDRSSRLYKDGWLARLYLHHLRETRNLLVHTARPIDDGFMEAVMYQLHRDVCALLELYIFNYEKFQSVEEMRFFLDLPENNDLIRTRISLMRTALKYRGADDKNPARPVGDS